MFIFVVMFILVIMLFFGVNNGTAWNLVVAETLILKTVGDVQAANVSAIGKRSRGTVIHGLSLCTYTEIAFGDVRPCNCAINDINDAAGCAAGIHEGRGSFSDLYLLYVR